MNLEDVLLLYAQGPRKGWAPGGRSMIEYDLRDFDIFVDDMKEQV